MSDLAAIYCDYIACLNRRDWDGLADFVADDVRYNDEEVELAGYREMLQENVRDIPDLGFQIGLLASDPPHVAARLLFNCTPAATFLGLPVNGRRVSFAENVFYRFEDERIAAVWSVVDRAAIEAQLRGLDAA